MLQDKDIRIICLYQFQANNTPESAAMDSPVPVSSPQELPAFEDEGALLGDDVPIDMDEYEEGEELFGENMEKYGTKPRLNLFNK